MNAVEGYFLGFVSCVAVVASALLAFVLFCPIWQDWTNVQPEVHVVNPPPQIYFIPSPNRSINFGEETPDKAPNIFPNTD